MAREEGISRQMASRVANSPEVRNLLDTLMATKRERIEATFDAMLDGIERLLDARDVRRLCVRGNDGRPKTVWIDAGPDHRTAMKGAMVFVRLLKRTGWLESALSTQPRLHTPQRTAPRKSNTAASGAPKPDSARTAPTASHLARSRPARSPSRPNTTHPLATLTVDAPIRPPNPRNRQAGAHPDYRAHDCLEKARKLGRVGGRPPRLVVNRDEVARLDEDG
jgi:hypothetical protein